MNFSTISELLGESPDLSNALLYEDVVTYIHLIHILKPDLSCWKLSDRDGPPERLPIAIHDFLKFCLGMEDKIAKIAWYTLRQIAWDVGPEEEDIRKHGYVRMKYLKLFLKHGPCCGIGDEIHSISLNTPLNESMLGTQLLQAAAS